MEEPYRHLGDWLVGRGCLREDQLEEALAAEKGEGELLGQVLVRLGHLPQEELIERLTEFFQAPHVDPSALELEPELAECFPRAVASRFGVIPLFRDGDMISVAMVNPNDIDGIERVERQLGATIHVCFTQPEELDRAIHRIYDSGEATSREILEISREYFDESWENEGEFVTGDTDPEDAEQLSETGPIIRAVNLIVSQAIRKRASDVHLQPEDRKLRIRYRIDGLLYDTPSPPKRLLPAIVTRIKVMSELDISEKRVPQDGHFRFKIDGRTVDLRTSIIPTIHGENVVLRVLDRKRTVTDLVTLGFAEEERLRFEKGLESPWGLILVTGPTGSGKSTTLYTALTMLNDPRRHIMTIEDPVENEIPGCQQIQIHPKAGLTFATGLRAILRHDPDIVMIGEIRDSETARIATQAALTGHLILSTLHVNDAPSAATRLINLGEDPFLLGASLLAVLAQRLVRTLCEECREPYELDPGSMRLPFPEECTRPFPAYRMRGCPACQGLGYRGRTGIYELMAVDREIGELISSGAATREIRDAAVRCGMRTLWRQGLTKVREGRTSLEELIRVTRPL